MGVRFLTGLSIVLAEAVLPLPMVYCAGGGRCLVVDLDRSRWSGPLRRSHVHLPTELLQTLSLSAVTAVDLKLGRSITVTNKSNSRT